jgi:Ca2+-binding EF-hand superfamily protein
MDARIEGEVEVEAMVDSHFEIMNSLLAEIQDVKAELAKTNKKMGELEGKLALYQETGSSNISRMMFRRYVLTSMDRQETDEEWRKFIETFENDNTTTTNNIYKWIDKNISR